MKKPKFKRPDIKKIWNFLLAMSRATATMVIALAVISGLMLYQLGELLPGLSQAEVDTFHSASSLGAITDNMVNAPYKIAVFVSTHVFDSVFGLRLTGAVLGILAIIIFYLLARRLFTGYVSLASTIMFATSTLVLSVTRQATPNVMLLSVLALVGTGFFLRFNKRPDIAWILVAVVVGLTIYVPGMLFFIVAAAIWQFKHARKSFEQLEPQFIIATSVILSLLCVPLVINLIREPYLWRAFLALPDEFPPIMEMLEFAGRAVAGLLALAPFGQSFWLGRQPVLDAFAIAMLFYGTYWLNRQYRLDRLWTMAGIFFLSMAWIAVTRNSLGVVLFIPFTYIVIGIGIQNFTNQWMKVFPKNPIARMFGGLLILVAIGFSVNFQSHRYFVAWPNNEQTKVVFNQRYPR